MLKGYRHLSDDRLIEACTSETLPWSVRRHLLACSECSTRRADLAALLVEVSEAAEAEADAAFPSARLARQQARVLHRIEQDGQPARVLAFPGPASEAGAPRHRPRTHWLAGAAAAGLVIGLVTGYTTRYLPGATVAVSQPAADRPSGSETAPQVTGAGVSEDELLGQIELAAVGGPGGSALDTLHDLTPRAWEVK